MRWGLFYALLLSVLSTSFATASNISLAGQLIDRPCHVAPEHFIQTVDFQTRSNRDFVVSPGRTSTKYFSIKLDNCHPSTMGKIVRVKFTGEPELALTGYLKVEGVNSGRLGIGIIDTDGKSLLELGKLHNSGQGTKINGDSVTLTYGAYVQAVPEAIKNKSVEPGTYNALVTFELFYN